ncbi:hypothetical protein HanXRQr2_Chr12g0526361 [Helianthus annuus]|uniref:Uncharacterized protein n=1 Tax=Helianthus annuus TaxID=4232 RepID=A0A9K3EQD7_HELAN|nr:hypothetical protein HanXRQr2_Chr12g0526361 [Helianthus annuus]KAJ0488304.1 hypothetical protein HanHA300_Chr12g0431441 [Helianthus annuus]KAJ0504141.1 hypothetical protein HanHA89_Chr12g0456021 [Helianthus annuus]KAJ0673830.1 hypothetical protein HanLR1_Chr12g0433311 [Helianthus annuus]KAJ0861480.1 hypothetical protein HanPSC8_Chr12g0507131 [Helianthus annuus]
MFSFFLHLQTPCTHGGLTDRSKAKYVGRLTGQKCWLSKGVNEVMSWSNKFLVSLLLD